MSFAVEQVENEPIISIRMLAPLNPVLDLTELYQKTDILTANIAGTIYRIVDWTEAKLTFDLVVELLDIQRKTTAATAPGSPRVKNHYIVSGEWDRFMIESLRQHQYGGVEAPMFSNLKEALNAVRKIIKDETIEIPLPPMD